MKERWVKYAVLGALCLGVCWLVLRPRVVMPEPQELNRMTIDEDGSVLIQTIDTEKSFTVYTAPEERAEVHSDIINEHLQTDMVNRHHKRVDDIRFEHTRERETRACESVKAKKDFQLRTGEAGRDHQATMLEAEHKLEYDCLQRNIEQVKDAIENVRDIQEELGDCSNNDSD